MGAIRTGAHCFCHVKNIVEALVRRIRSEKARGEIFDLGATHEITMADLARTVIAATGSSSTVEFVPYADAYAPGFEEMLRRRPSVEKLKAAIGFAPATSLDEIIKDTVRALRGAG